MMNFFLRALPVFGLLLLSLQGFSQQAPRGRYRPTKYDSVRKVIPPQVYGRPGSTPQPTPTVIPVDTVKTPTKKMVNDPDIKQPEPTEREIKTNLSESELQQRLIRKQEPKKTEPKKTEPKKKEVRPTPAPVKESVKRYSEPTPRENEVDNRLEDRISKMPERDKNRGQATPWSLQECIAYAREHNLQVAESELNERLSRLMYQQVRSSRLPNLNADASLGDSYGRSIDPTSNQFVTQGFIYNSLGISSQVLVFGWFQKQYQIDQNKLEVEAAHSAYQQLRDDIALNVATGYLRVLLAREQVNIAGAKIKLDQEQYEQTLRFAQAGKLPELNVAQMASQLSSDTASMVSAQADERVAMLQLRALMNFDLDQPFDIQVPDTRANGLEGFVRLPDPEQMFQHAVQTQHRMKYNAWKLLSAKKSLDIARAGQYPQLSIFANLGTNFSSNVKDITGQTYVGEVALGYVQVAGTSYPITRPDYTYTTRTRPLFTQYGNNIRANAGISLNVPLFNAYAARTSIQKAKIGLVSQQIALDNDKQKLQQDIYKAYEEARAASQKYMAAKRAEDAARRAQDFAVKRYGAGMISTFEYTTTVNNLTTSSSAVLSAKYDLIFKLKILDYYMGNALNLD